jgi:hypothetical protein
MRLLRTIDQVDVRPGDEGRGWDRMIRLDVLKQFNKLTYALKTDEEDGQMRVIQTIHQVDVLAGNGKRRRSDEVYSNNSLSSRT